ncbi:sulfurtransferase TusA family protein [Cellulomonas sp. P24]|jgi:tRNA 2-thiouridine synthesizing protein A|uniref:sulfurtransferase TusA family protein n=1 Tax=Cellulomonas sp. P24 TaxID=2885206 RepID=UPI00216B453D|nr:sulfurtransferase TusA family protein [Cellulomonas sp. P24]MCR6494382.1 sulfurtransferase TusA family protein [Cellulomonas sp. P24]
MTVAAEELKALTIAQVVDARGTSCPGPILAAKKAIGGVPVNGVMEVLATDSGTLKDLPAWSKKMGHEFLGSFDDAGYLHLYLRKMK